MKFNEDLGMVEINPGKRSLPVMAICVVATALITTVVLFFANRPVSANTDNHGAVPSGMYVDADGRIGNLADDPICTGTIGIPR